MRVAILPSPRASSAAITPSARKVSPGQPSPTIEAPAMPNRPYSLARSSGNSVRSQNPAAAGATRVSHHTRTLSRISRSASVSNSSRP